MSHGVNSLFVNCYFECSTATPKSPEFLLNGFVIGGVNPSASGKSPLSLTLAVDTRLNIRITVIFNVIKNFLKLLTFKFLYASKKTVIRIRKLDIRRIFYS